MSIRQSVEDRVMKKKKKKKKECLKPEEARDLKRQRGSDPRMEKVNKRL